MTLKVATLAISKSKTQDYQAQNGCRFGVMILVMGIAGLFIELRLILLDKPLCSHSSNGLRQTTYTKCAILIHRYHSMTVDLGPDKWNQKLNESFTSCMFTNLEYMHRYSIQFQHNLTQGQYKILLTLKILKLVGSSRLKMVFTKGTSI